MVSVFNKLFEKQVTIEIDAKICENSAYFAELKKLAKDLRVTRAQMIFSR